MLILGAISVMRYLSAQSQAENFKSANLLTIRYSRLPTMSKQEYKNTSIHFLQAFREPYYDMQKPSMCLQAVVYDFMISRLVMTFWPLFPFFSRQAGQGQTPILAKQPQNFRQHIVRIPGFFVDGRWPSLTLTEPRTIMQGLQKKCGRFISQYANKWEQKRLKTSLYLLSFDKLHNVLLLLVALFHAKKIVILRINLRLSLSLC